jgi:hypothetical protein
MADLPPYSTPRWVKILGIVALVLVLLFGILHLTGFRGHHGPGQHLPSGGSGTTPRSSVTVDHPSFGGGSRSHPLPVEHALQQP